MKKYPEWTDFQIDETCYGLGAPFVGIGIYTVDKKFSWPDRDGTTKKEYDSWVSHLLANGYDIPDGYINAYAEEQTK